MTENNQSGKLTRDEKKGLFKWGIGTVVVLFLIVVLFIDNCPFVVYPIVFIGMFVVPMLVGYAMYWIWWLIMKIFTGRNIYTEISSEEWKYK